MPFVIGGLFAGLLEASCGSASCPIDTLSLERGGSGWFRLGYEFEYIDQGQPRLGTSKAAVGEQRGHHDEVYTVNRLHRLTASAGVTDRLSLDLLLPYVSRSHQHIHHHGGGDLLETWDISGVGDLTALARFAFLRPDQTTHPTLLAILGGQFPTGKKHEMNDDGDEAETAIQPGSGAYDLIVGLGSHQSFSVPMVNGAFATMPLFLTTTYQFNGKGTDDYRLGNMLVVNLGTSYPIVPRLGFLTQLNVKVKERDSRGETFEETDKTGGEFIYLSPGLELHLTYRLHLSVLAQLPVYQRVNQIQLTSDYNLLTNLSYQFQL